MTLWLACDFKVLPECFWVINVVVLGASGVVLEPFWFFLGGVAPSGSKGVLVVLE